MDGSGHGLTLTLALWTPGPLEIGAILVVGLLLFGRRLPEVGRSVGRSIVEFKKGLKGVEDEIESAGDAPASKPSAVKPPLAEGGVDPRVSHGGEEMGTEAETAEAEGRPTA
ncbi:MAG: twin-arginine translocase TatA/TatE family subunit [Planctomycetota bacterium]